MAVTRPPIGKLRQVVKFERNEATQLGAGKKDNYVEWVTTRGKLEYKRGSRTLQSGEGVIIDGWELTVRWQQELENYMSKSIKVICNNMIFTVDSYQLIGEQRRYYRLKLNEKK